MLAQLAMANTIKSKAKELGFFACGIAKASFLEEESVRLRKWLDQKRHGEMGYMENHFEKRTDPSKLVQNAKSVIVLLYNYSPPETLSKNDFRISKYAYGHDYHNVIKSKLKDLLSFIQNQFPETAGRAFVDSAPVLERSLAQLAGLGWIGKNTCLITKEQGSYFFISELIIDLELPEDKEAVPNHCGGCTRCIQACPTGALDDKGLDSNKCISYLTIEYRKDQLPADFTDKMEGWIFGCDTCQDVCPWNRFSEPHDEPEFKPSDELGNMKNEDWINLDEEKFRSLFRKSPVKRTKFSGLKRNINFIANPPIH